jgi:hypothetical protein
VEEYHPRREAELSYYVQLPPTRELIEKATLALRCDGKRHSHQRLIPHKVLAAMSKRLRRHSKKVLAASDFHSLWMLIKQLSIPGFGELARYDTALRIAARLGCLPTRVYLHAGTRTGARALGLKIASTSLEIVDVRKELHCLQAYEIEDFLCVFKHKVKKLAKKG